MILRARQRPDRVAVAEAQDAQLLALQELFDHHLVPGTAELLVDQHAFQRLFGFRLGPGQEHALSGRQAVGLDHDVEVHLLHVCLCSLEVSELAEPRGRNVVPHHEVFRVGLGAFHAGGPPGWSKASQASFPARGLDARHERSLRARDNQVHVMLGRESDDGGEIVGIDASHMLGLGQALTGAPVARQDVERLDIFRLVELPCQGMLTAAAANEKDSNVFHYALAL